MDKYRDASASFEQRADDLVGRMTLEEKIGQLTYDAPAIERLGLPAHNWWNECLHGVGRAGVATVFPQAIALAATFDAGLVHRVAVAISDEARAKHHAHAARGDRGIYKGLTYWSPNINILRDPRWGRGHETYGECPYLTARLGVAFVRGLQGDDTKYLKVVATPKHYAVHSGPEAGRRGFDVTVSERDLRETYLPAFKACVVEGGAFSVMGAYNRLAGVPCCANGRLLDEILREEWGFAGYTVSDCGAISHIHVHHKYVATPAEAAATAVKHGLDLCCGNDFRHLHEAFGLGLISEAEIDRSVRRLMLARLKLGTFDAPESVKWAQIPYDVVDSPAHRALALEAARRSVVLLKNRKGTLPLGPGVKRVALIGPNADAREVLLGNYHGTPTQIVSPRDALVRRLGRDGVFYAQGCEHIGREGMWLGTKTRGFVEAVLAAERADVVVMCMGLNPTIEGEEGDAMNSDAAGDRSYIELPPPQEQLMQAVRATGKPLVVVFISGSCIASPWAAEHADAIVQQFYPGQDGGTALMEVLFGECNPSGRLPMTCYRATADVPPFASYAMKGRTYRYFEGRALYPFGFGLSYTQFGYSDLRVSKVGGGVRVEARVKNVGQRAGTEMAQVYLRHASGGPIRQLAGLAAVELKAGESRQVAFELSADQLMLVSEDGRLHRPTGPWRVSVGGCQDDGLSQELGGGACVSVEV